MSKFPYPGLRPFERDEDDIFFGREKQKDQLIERLRSTHFLAVVGPSGYGKSSLVRTGMLADLKNVFRAVGIHWRVAEMRPGNCPFANLTHALLEETALGPEYTTHATDTTKALAFLQADLRRGPKSVHEILDETPLPEGTNLLLLVDQFEEIFRYRRLKTERATDEAEAFVKLLLTCSEHPAVYVVITMRSDFMGDCALFQGLPEKIDQGLFLIPRFDREELRAAIEEPAKLFNGKVEEVLVNRLLNDAGYDPERLPVLQHALMRMWDFASKEKADKIVLTLKHYIKIGTLSDALSNHANEAYDNDLDESQQKIAETLFRNLSERSNDDRRDTRRLIKLEEIAELANVSWQEVAAVVEVFRKPGRSFLVPYSKKLEASDVIDISHECLISKWKRLRKWTEQEFEDAKLYQRLEESAFLWKDKKAALWRTPELERALKWREKTQPTTARWASRYGEHFDLVTDFLEASEAQKQKEQRQIERQRWQQNITFGLIFFSIVASGLAGIAGWQWWESQQKGEKANKLLQIQTENNLFNAIRLVDIAHQVLERFLDEEMKKAFVTFINAYQLAGNDPTKMDLEAIKRQLGGKMDLYMINSTTGIVEYTTYEKDLGFDFKKWPDLLALFQKILQTNEFANGGFATEFRTGIVRKFAYIPTPDKKYILELGLISNEFAKLVKKLDTVKIIDRLKTLNPSLNQVRIFTRHGYSLGDTDYKVDQNTLEIIKTVYETQETVKIADKSNKHYKRYLFVNLKDENRNDGSDSSKVIELTYNDINYK